MTAQFIQLHSFLHQQIDGTQIDIVFTAHKGVQGATRVGGGTNCIRLEKTEGLGVVILVEQIGGTPQDDITALGIHSLGVLQHHPVTMNIHHSQGAVECDCDSGRMQTTHGSTSRTHNNQQNELPTNPTLLSSNWTSSTRAYRDPSRREENQQGIRDDVEPPNKEDREEELDDNYTYSFKHSFPLPFNRFTRVLFTLTQLTLQAI